MILRIWPFRLDWLPGQTNNSPDGFSFMRHMTVGCYVCGGVITLFTRIVVLCFLSELAALSCISFVSYPSLGMPAHTLFPPFLFCTNFFLPCHYLVLLEFMGAYWRIDIPRFWCWVLDNDLVMTWTGISFYIMIIPHLFIIIYLSFFLHRVYKNLFQANSRAEVRIQITRKNHSFPSYCIIIKSIWTQLYRMSACK